MSFDQSVDTENQAEQPEQRPDEMSGQWIRDQLVDTAGSDPEPQAEEAAPVAVEQEPAAEDTSPDGPLSGVVESLAKSISEAVAAPLETFERERQKQTDEISDSIKEHDHRITAAFAALQQVEDASRSLSARVDEQETPTRETREIVDRLQGRSEELQSEIRREAENVSSSIGSLRSELEGFAQRLSHAEVMIEKQRAAMARLETLERRRTESLGEMARLMGNVQQALEPAAVDAGGDDQNKDQQPEG